MKLGARLAIIALTAVISGAATFYATDLLAPTPALRMAPPPRPALGARSR